MRMLWVCVAAACTGVARVAPQHSGSDDAAGISARALVRGRGRCCHSLNSNNSFTHSFTPNSTPCPGWAAIWVAHSLFAPPRPSSACLPPLHKGVRSTVWRLTNERANASRSLIRDPFPIPIRFAPIRCESDSDRCLWWGSFCGARVALCSSEKWKRKWETKNDNDHSSITEKQQQQLRQQQQQRQQLSNLYLSLCISVYLSVQYVVR